MESQNLYIKLFGFFFPIVTVRTLFLGLCAGLSAVLTVSGRRAASREGTCGTVPDQPRDPAGPDAAPCRPGGGRDVFPGLTALQSGLAGSPWGPCHVPLALGRRHQLEKRRWIQCSRNKPADFQAACRYLMCSRNTDGDGSAGTRVSLSISSGTHARPTVPCDLPGEPGGQTGERQTAAARQRRVPRVTGWMAARCALGCATFVQTCPAPFGG